MPNNRKNNDEFVENVQEAGDIGDEQLPAGFDGKTDKAKWNFASSKDYSEETWSDKLNKFLQDTDDRSKH